MSRLVIDVQTGKKTIMPDAPALPPEPKPTLVARRAAIDKALNDNEPLKLILEAIEDIQGVPRGKLITDAKAKVKT